MVKINYNNKEIEVSSLEDFYNNHFDKESLTDDYTLSLSRKLYNDDGSYFCNNNIFYLEKKLEINIKDGDFIQLFSKKIFNISGGLAFSN